mmetsp:Transcript_20013/g.47727  ORF Transcript_20013/g.47727 Transcript_20013/m.47727 type:complete len:288 (-) Transcript_20013:986-1849(-)
MRRALTAAAPACTAGFARISSTSLCSTLKFRLGALRQSPDIASCSALPASSSPYRSFVVFPAWTPRVEAAWMNRRLTHSDHQCHNHNHNHELHEHDDCWSCAASVTRDDFFCSSCSRIQPPSQKNYFELLACPRRFDIDLKKLEQNYWRLQKRLHPDLFYGKEAMEKEYSQQQASLLNEAYNTLKKPDLRAQYLLELMGVDFSEGAKMPVDATLLMTVMELREELEDAGDEVEKLEDIGRRTRALVQETIVRAANAFNAENREAALDCATWLKYLSRLTEQLQKQMP